MIKLLKDQIKIITPLNPKERGNQISILIEKNVDTLNDLLFDNGVICDIRKPNIIRIAPVPLYNTFKDVLEFVIILKKLIQNIK